MLRVEEGAQGTGGAILNIDHLGVFLDRYCALERLREQKLGGSSVTDCFVTHGEDGHLKLLAVGAEVVGAACKQAFGEGDKVGAMLFVEEDFGTVGKHEICRGKPDALFGQVTPYASAGGVAVLLKARQRQRLRNRRLASVLREAEANFQISRLTVLSH